MERNNFINIKNNMFDICEKLASNGGNCKEINCEDCPFSKKNSTNDKFCNDNGYTTHTALKQEKDYTLVQSAIKFLGFKNNNEATFYNAKVGDRAWSFEYGWGTITHVFHDNEYPINFESDTKRICNFMIDGKRNVKDINPTLFWNEIKFEIPKKPFNLEKELRELDRIEFRTGKDNYFLVWSNKLKHIVNSCLSSYQNPFLICFTEESINNFMNNIKDKEITKEQFFTAYKNVFRDKV